MQIAKVIMARDGGQFPDSIEIYELDKMGDFCMDFINQLIKTCWTFVKEKIIAERMCYSKLRYDIEKKVKK